MKPQDTYVELGFEYLLTNLYGRSGNPVRAGFTSLPSLKKACSKVFTTLAKASRRSICGDDRHRDRILERCNWAIAEIKKSKSKDEVSQIALSRSLELNFLLLGHLPLNWKGTKPGWRAVVDLAEFRTLSYVRSDKQKINEILDHAYRLPGEDEDSIFTKLIEIRNKHPHDDYVALAKMKELAPEIYRKFNTA